VGAARGLLGLAGVILACWGSADRGLSRMAGSLQRARRNMTGTQIGCVCSWLVGRVHLGSRAVRGASITAAAGQHAAGGHPLHQTGAFRRSLCTGALRLSPW
jgi:hypothetical protein